MIAICPKCNRRWKQAFDKCIFCNVQLEKGEMQANEKFKVGIVGAGFMGKQVAALLLSKQNSVVLVGRSAEKLESAKKEIHDKLLKTLSDEEVNRAIERLDTTTEYEKLSTVNLVIELVSENLDIKQTVLEDIENFCSMDCTIATGTSSLTVEALTERMHSTWRVVGMHFFSPVESTQLIEIVKTGKSSEDSVDKVKKLAVNLGKETIIVKDSPCFVVNRALIAFLNEVCYEVEEGIASAKEIDESIKMALNHPMGPLRLIDYVGLDVFADTARNAYMQTDNPRFKLCPLVDNMIEKGKLGKKSGEGFFKY